MDNTFNVLEVTQMAVNMEERGHYHYAKAAKFAENEGVRNMFLMLAEQEKKHEGLFKQLYELLTEIHDIDDSYMLDESVSLYFKALVEHQVFKYSDLHDIVELTSVSEAIKEGINAEKNSILFYTELLRHTKSKKVIDVLEIIIDEEKKHLIELQELLQTL